MVSNSYFRFLIRDFGESFSRNILPLFMFIKSYFEFMLNVFSFTVVSLFSPSLWILERTLQLPCAEAVINNEMTLLDRT